MSKIVSSPTTMWVQPPRPAPTGFANGTQAGSFDAATDTWTPGTSNGVVNQVSWAQVPTGRWVKVAGTRLDSLSAQVLAAVPGWTEPTLAWNGVMDAWNGFAIDSAGCRVWLAAAGGHNNGHNNGIYRFDAYKMTWAVERMPSDRSLWSERYKNLSPAPQTYSSTFCAESEEQRSIKAAAGTLNPINDWFSDELVWDRRPTARHVYSSVVYVPATNELVMGCRRLWRYSLTAGDWTYRRQFPRSVDGAEVYGIYDERTNEYLFGGAGDGVRASLGYNLTTNQWTNWGSPWSQYCGADTRHGRTVTFFAPPLLGNSYYVGQYWTYDLDSRRVLQAANAQFAGGLARTDFRGTGFPYGLYDGGCALVYIPQINRYWITLLMRDGMRWLQLDPTTSPWTLSPLTFANASPASRSLVCRKLVFLPDLNAVVFFSDATGPGHIFKF